MRIYQKPPVFFSLLFVHCLFVLSVQSQSGPKISYHFNKQARCRNGAVVSAHPLASLIGIQMLKQGGNAVDAAIATQLALAVVYPGAGNIGGGGFMVARLAKGKNITIDFRERAPVAATRNMYLDSQENVVPGKSENG